MAWQSVQICPSCWHKANPGKQPLVLLLQFREQTQCADCGFPTKSGIYVRRDVQEAN